MKKILYIAILFFIFLTGYSQVPITSGMTGLQLRNALNTNFNYLYGFMNGVMNPTTGSWANPTIGNNAIDFQRDRYLVTQKASGSSSIIFGGANNTASGDYSIVMGGNSNLATGNYSAVGGLYNQVSGSYSTAFGSSNIIQSFPFLPTTGQSSFAAGSANDIRGLVGFGIGISNYTDATMGGGFGNNNIVSTNDGFAAGNQNYLGRILFWVAHEGLANAGTVGGVALGNRYYTDIVSLENDVTDMFPYKGMLVDSVIARYGVGAKIDTNGFVYSTTSPTLYSDALWAAKPFGMARGSAEGSDTLMKIVNCVYTGGHTRVYWEPNYIPTPSGAAIYGVFGTYSPDVAFRSYGAGGNGGISLGKFCDSWGMGSVAIGTGSEVRGGFSTAIGFASKVFAPGSTAIGGSYISRGASQAMAIGENDTITSIYSYALGRNNKISGVGGYSIGSDNKSSASSGYIFGASNTSTTDYGGLIIGQSNTVTARYPIIIGYGNRVDNTILQTGSFVEGWDARDHVQPNYREKVFSSGKNNTIGDCQTIEYTWGDDFTGAGWFIVPVMYMTDTVSMYTFEVQAMFEDITIGNADYKHGAGYIFTGVFGTHLGYSAMGTGQRTLLGENISGTADYVDDYTYTYPYMQYGGQYDPPLGRQIYIRFLGVAGHTYRVVTSGKITQMF